MKRTLGAISCAAMAVGILAGCGSGEEENQPKFPLSGLQDYDTPDQIASDLNEGGFDCQRFERKTGSMNATSSGNCWWPGGGGKEQEIILMIFNSDSNKEEQANLYRSIGEVFGEEVGDYGLVEGGNWMVNCGNREACDGVANALGGRIEIEPMFES
ncbi:hypothetical protein [Dietzia maris]|uniref:hypothetical protein n=1 Tax=Dietzia maris TaxID=37915 RepID=UPI0037C8C515